MSTPESFSHDPHQALSAGQRAPDFCLRTTPDQWVKLEEFRGRPVVLAFYPADWSPVCSDEMALFNEALPEFQRLGACLLGISVDGVWSHIAFEKHRKLKFPLLSDFEPKGATAAAYGAFRRSEGICERALFVIDGDGVVHWSYVSPIGVSPGVDGVLDALEELKEQGNGQQAAAEKAPEAQSVAEQQKAEKKEEVKL